MALLRHNISKLSNRISYGTPVCMHACTMPLPRVIHLQHNHPYPTPLENTVCSKALIEEAEKAQRKKGIRKEGKKRGGK